MPPRNCLRRPPVCFTAPALLSLLFAAACGPPPQGATASLPAFRAVWLQPVHWAHADADSAASKIRRFVAAIAATGQPTLLVQIDGEAAAASPGGFDPLSVTLSAGHENGLRVHAGLSLTISSGESPAAARARWKDLAQHVATHYEVDGLHFDERETISGIGAAVEALLVKPYLVISGSTLGDVAGLQPVHGALASNDTTHVSWRADASQVVALDLSRWRLGGATGLRVRVDSAAHESMTDAAGRVGILLPALPDTLGLVVDGDSLALETRFWKPPYRFVVTAGGSVTRAEPWVELRAAPATSTTRDVFEFLGRTDATAQASVNGIDTEVYATGVFFDSVALVEGPNRVRLEARWPDGGGVAVYEAEFERRIEPPRPRLPLWIDAESVQPSDTLALLSMDIVRLSFRGSPGQQATARIRPGKLEIPFFQRSCDEGIGLYEADLQLSRLQPGRSYQVEIRLRQADGSSQIRHRLEHPIEVRQPHDFPLLVTSARESYLSWSLGRVRLGGPYQAEYPEGVVLQANGIFGRRYRVRLGPQVVGFISRRYVDVAPAGSVRPHYYLRSLSVSATDSTDVVRIPRPEPVPYVVRSDPDGRRILVTLYGVETSSTWLAHRTGLRFVDKAGARSMPRPTR
jgi:hypothetical protein